MGQINQVFVAANDDIVAVHPYDQTVAPDAYGSDIRVAFFDALDVSSPVENVLDDEGRVIGGKPRRLPSDWEGSHVPPLPDSVTSTQGKLALIEAGLYEAVEGAINDVLDPKERLIAQAKFAAARWYRADPMFAEVAKALDLPSAQFDALWRDAMAR